jgi:hypothetical protein
VITDTPTPSPTPTATPDYYVEMTTPQGDAARLSREVSIADLWMVGLLSAILFSQWLMHFADRFKEKGVSTK